MAIGWNLSKDLPEDYLILKLIGYQLLGTFTINIDWIQLPVGLVIVYFMNQKQNRKAKLTVAVIGYILSVLLY
ncbi:hypothetical protein [Alteribacter natronophilus]|uniref:hypothetical protein n=1 Tax=Alteribacter natronophilus TaxID=2583810 RepID=UPI00110D6159|nr:hypothetical protein [Alteribacter natronophilus]TMW71045.1 hypothetical protein FGB90_13835 [Alteribacter natronophilus]